jgi:hypothetical protein
VSCASLAAAIAIEPLIVKLLFLRTPDSPKKDVENVDLRRQSFAHVSETFLSQKSVLPPLLIF